MDAITVASAEPQAGAPRARAVLRTLRRDWWIVVLAVMICALGAVGYCLSKTPVYAATSTLYVTSATDDSSATAYQGSLASEKRVASYVRLVNSKEVLERAINQGHLSISLDEARTMVSATAPPDTVMLSITARGTDKGLAVGLANAVSDAMVSYVGRLETPNGGGQPLARLTVVNPAEPPAGAVSPRTTLILVSALLLGLIIGLAIIAVRSTFNNKIETASDINRLSELPVLAEIPLDRGLKSGALIDFSTGLSRSGEAFRHLRTSISFTRVDTPPRVILVTSSDASEGKTTVSTNFAAALAESGKSVVLVDGDLRRPMLTNRVPGVADAAGFTNWLRGDAKLEDLIQVPSDTGVSVLSSGPIPPNPAEILESSRVSMGFEILCKFFDYVIVDSAPVLPVTDSVVLSHWVDGVVIAVRSGKTRYPQLTRAIQSLSTVGTPILGFVLLAVDPGNDESYSSGYGYISSEST